MEIVYKSDTLPSAAQVATLYAAAGLPRPIHDLERLRQMFENADLVITAWNGEQLAGVCRCITDWQWCCYLSDLAVDPQYKKQGIGTKLVDICRQSIGDRCMLLLLSVPDAMDYYQKIGFEKDNRCFSIPRKK
jgi:ribosomal protein S18 acetylase RimI-like enzyme